MKRFLCLIAAVAVFGSEISYAEKLDSSKITGQTQVGDFVFADTDSGDYVLDSEHNIIYGPFTEIYALHRYNIPDGNIRVAKSDDGNKVYFDVDGTLLTYVSKSEDFYGPYNGIYVVGPKAGGDYEADSFTVYDYKSREELFRSGFRILPGQYSDGKLLAEKDGKFAIADHTGALLTDFDYDRCAKFFGEATKKYIQDYAVMIRNGEKVYLDENAREFNPADYNGERFITGYIRMNGIDNSQDPYKEYYRVLSGEATAIYDNSEKKYLFPFMEGTAFYEMNDRYIIAQNGGEYNDGYIGSYLNAKKYALLDYEGNVIMPFEYDFLKLSKVDGFVNYSKGDESGVFDLFTGTYLPGISGEGVGYGLLVQYDYTTSSWGRRRIVNYAGHPITDWHVSVAYKDGEIYTYGIGGDLEKKAEWDKDFAVINLNRSFLDFDGTIRNGRTLVPVREIVEGLGGTVNWDDATGSVRAIVDGKSLEMQIGSYEFKVDGNLFELDVPAQLINNKTMLPVRAICESLGAEVRWDDRIRCVFIMK